MANSSFLTPAFTPEYVMMSGGSAGHLGQYMKGCKMPTPSAPCGGKVEIGDLGANLTGTKTQMSSESSMSTNAVNILVGTNGLLCVLAAAALF